MTTNIDSFHLCVASILVCIALFHLCLASILINVDSLLVSFVAIFHCIESIFTCIATILIAIVAMLYNKLDKPIYIDWKNSSFIRNDDKWNYWIDETQTNIASYYGGYFYKGPLLKPGFAINEGIQNSSSSSIKPEKVTFIPPKSNYYRSQFYLLPIDYYELNLKCKKTIVPRSDDPQKQTTIYSEEYSANNSPLRFRNYLAISFNENAQQFFFIDNNFYLSSIKEIDFRHFQGKSIEDRSFRDPHLAYGESAFKKETSFYIKLKDINSVEYRINYENLHR